MSPFKSEAQRKYLFANHPELAHKWAQEEEAAKKAAKKKPKKSKKGKGRAE